MANGLFGGIIWASQQATGGGIKGTVATFNDLPAAADHPAEIWVVLTTTRVPLLDWHSKGLYYSDSDLRSYMALDVRNSTDGLFDAIKITSNGFVGLKGITDPQNFLHIKTRYNAGSQFNGAIRVENWTNTGFGMIDHIIGGIALRNNGYYNQSGTVTPKATSYSQITLGAGVIDFLVNASLTVDTPFEPTILMKLNSTGQLLLGYSADNADANHLLQVSKTGFSGMGIFSFGNAAAETPFFNLNRSRGTVNGTKTQTASNDLLGVFDFKGVTSGSTFATGARIVVVQEGTSGASNVPGQLQFHTSNGSSVETNKMTITGAGNVVLGNQAALATNAIDGFTYVPTCAGAPTGAATAYTGKVAMVVDTTNNRVYFRVGSTWRYATLT